MRRRARAVWRAVKAVYVAVMAELVDKHWFKNGLVSYSTAQVLATLAHYGVVVTEAELGEQLATREPEELATAWDKVWTGKGKFKNFHHVAAELLFVRLTARGALGELLEVLDEAVAEALELDEPCELGEPEARSLNESLAILKTPAKLNKLAEEVRRAMLLGAGHARPEQMKLLARFATDDAVLTECIVAHHADRAVLVAELTKLLDDPALAPRIKVEVSWHLYDLDAPPTRRRLLDLLAGCEETGDLRLGANIATLLGEVCADELGSHYCAECRAYHPVGEISHPEFDDDDDGDGFDDLDPKSPF